MATLSAGLVLHRLRQGGREVLLGHMGGPLWVRKQEAAWSFPKGLVEPGEAVLAAARREFREETGLEVPSGPMIDLGPVRQRSGKTVHLHALEADLDLTAFQPGTFTMTWPPRSGRTIEAPEIDQLRWVPVAESVKLLVQGQRPFLERLERALA